MKKKRKYPKSQRTSLIRKADSVFRAYILRTRPAACQWCGREGKMVYVAHILPKGAYPRLRYCLDNVLLLCYHCHMFKAHKDPLAFNDFVKMMLGNDLREKLMLQNRTGDKLNAFKLGMLIEYYKNA